MKVISETALKDRMSDYFREVEATGEELLVTKDGQLVLKIISYHRSPGEADLRPKDHGGSR
jgi:antitoxin (DNA-binding transcriptional repressor) of toxin-antitoxin stability system